MSYCAIVFCFFFFNDTATTEIYTLSLHDALPILEREQPGDDERVVSELEMTQQREPGRRSQQRVALPPAVTQSQHQGDRKSTRLNSSHGYISYAVFCLKKKKIRRGIMQ